MLVPVEVVVLGLVPGFVFGLVVVVGLVWDWCRVRGESSDKDMALVQWSCRAISAENELNRVMEVKYGDEDLGQEYKESGG